MASAASPCLLPLYPSFLAYLTSNTEALAGRRGTSLLGLIILAGVLTSMLGVAIVLIVIALPISAVLPYLIPLIDGILITLGVLLLVGRNPFERLPGMRSPTVANPFGRAYAYGLLLGPLALPCAGAFALSLIAYSVGLADALEKAVVFLVYGLGFGLPLVVLSALAGTRQGQIVRFVAAHHRAIEIVGGALLVAVGIGDLIVNLENLRLTFQIWAFQI